MLSWIEKKMLASICKKMGVTLTKDNLVLAFQDLDGNGYYKFPKGIEMPLSRLAKVQEYLMWMSRGVSKEEYHRALDIAEQAMNNGIKDVKGMAKIGFVLAELKERSNMVIHDELFYNVIAAQLVRQDESVTEFNNEIHMQKVAAFKELDRLNDTFFLNIQEYLEAFNLSNISKREFETLMTASLQVRVAMETMLSSLSEK
jgi:hypothetical protein